VTRTLTARDLFTQLQERLGLSWVAARDHGEDTLLSEDDMSTRPALAGYLNLIHPNRVQVLGAEELAYLATRAGKDRERTLERIFEPQLIAAVVGSSLELPEDFLQAAERAGKPVLRSSSSSYDLVNYLQYHISRVLARRCNLHGVFMEVFTIGVLITGGAGSGKSELALELLNRGHRLIADDAPEFTLISPEVIDGSCPEALQDCLEVRGLGVLNVREMFGDAAIKLNKFLRLIVHLEIPEGGSAPENIDRLRGNTGSEDVLGLTVPTFTLPVLAGRNMAVITEAAVRDFMLRMKGFDAATAFLERHSRLLRGQPVVQGPHPGAKS
jgi:HPr kinase/phosphorylase